MQLSTPDCYLTQNVSLVKARSGMRPVNGSTGWMLWLETCTFIILIPMTIRFMDLGRPLGCAVPTKSGKLLLGLKDGLATIDLSTIDSLPHQGEGPG